MSVGEVKKATIVEHVKKIAYRRITSTAFNKFGKEFIFHGEGGADWNSAMEFIEKYDKRFTSHFGIPEDFKRDKSARGYIDYYNAIPSNFTFPEFLIIPIKNPKSGFYDTFLVVRCGISILTEDNMVGRMEFNFFSENARRIISLYICGKRYPKLSKDFTQLVKANSKRGEIVYIYTISATKSSMDNYQTRNLRSQHTKRYEDTIFYSNGEWEAITRHIDNFGYNMDMYKSKGLKYKTGILLHGVPGTGKSSLAKIIASKYNRDIVNINVSDIPYLNLSEIAEAINNDTDEQYVVLLEDIDTIVLNRKDKNVDHGEVINELLQFLDSSISPTNVIIIATTNHLDQLDDALTRDGRFDLKVDVRGVDIDGAIRFGKSMGLQEPQIREILKNTPQQEDHLWNQSTLQNRFLNALSR